VGERRFDGPHPHPPWPGALDADLHGPTPQRRPFGPVTTIPEPSIPGESTLNLNVFTPAPGDAGARLPVMVWIHGGGFFAGSPASPWYDGASFNRDGVVTVSISYRLGFDGFGWIEDAPANRGILDQIAALEWVQENIAAFGGDPARVTIAGQSAGASSVLTLLVVPRAQPLFAAAIAQSPAVAASTQPEVSGARFADRFGVEPTRAGWSRLSEEQILDGQAELQRPPDSEADPADRAAALVRAVTAGEVEHRLPFVPSVDGTLIPEGAVAAIAQGTGREKRLLLGSTAHELTMATAPMRDSLGRRDPATMLADAGVDPSTAEVFADRFPDFDAGRLLGQLVTEHLFRLPLLDLVDARQRGGGAGTWLYDFRWRSPIIGLAAHCHELPFVWDLLDGPGVAQVLGSDPPRQLARAMHRAWVGFIQGDGPGWAACSAGQLPGTVFDVEQRQARDPYRIERQLRTMP
jgi:para-nitrobenzyl esterase